jgi:hypothetical protein
MRRLRTDLLDIMPPQIPARGIAEVRHKSIDARLHDRCANRVLHLIKVVDCGVQTANFYLFDRLSPEMRPEPVGDIDQGREAHRREAHPQCDLPDSHK